MCFYIMIQSENHCSASHSNGNDQSQHDNQGRTCQRFIIVPCHKKGSCPIGEITRNQGCQDGQDKDHSRSLIKNTLNLADTRTDNGGNEGGYNDIGWFLEQEID